jgi:RNA polymerase sigma-70 factor (ECF subfamily)
MGALETFLGNGSAIVPELFRTNIHNPESTKPDSRARKARSDDVKFAAPVVRNDWDLIRRAAVGNPEAQERLFKTHTPRLYRAVYPILRNREDAEDAVQESWCKAYANLDSFEGRAAFSTWLTRIAINSALMLRRRKSYRVESSLNDLLDNQSESFMDRIVCQSPNPEQIYAANELNALIEDQISELPPRVQATFRLRKIEEFSITEAARALGVRKCAVKSRVSRARKKVSRGLRKLLSAPPRPRSVDSSSVQRRLNKNLRLHSSLVLTSRVRRRLSSALNPSGNATRRVEFP